MSFRVVRGCALGLLLLATGATPALAGGWAITTLDSLPRGGLHAGQSYSIGFTVRQHGVSPFNQAQPRIRATSGAAQINVGATRDGNGHYVAAVEFPTAGTWTWKVDQTPFAIQDLGTLEVLPADGAAPPAAAAAVPAPEQAIGGYLLAGLLALLVLLWGRPLPRLIA